MGGGITEDQFAADEALAATAVATASGAYFYWIPVKTYPNGQWFFTDAGHDYSASRILLGDYIHTGTYGQRILVSRAAKEIMSVLQGRREKQNWIEQ